MAALMSRAWPGNVRELRQVLDAASVFANGAIDAAAIDAAVANRGASPPNANSPARSLAERSELVAVLEGAAWDTSRAASELGIHRATMYRRMKRHGSRCPACRIDREPPVWAVPRSAADDANAKRSLSNLDDRSPLIG